MKFYFSITYLCVNFLNEWLWMIFSWCLWECDPLCDLWWSQWMFDLRWIPGAAICRGNHDPHLLSWLSWLLTADSWRLSRSVPRPHPLVTPGLFSSPGLSGPVIMTAGERREGGDVQPPPGTSRWGAESDPDPYWVLRAHNHHTEQSGHWDSAARCSAA